MRRLLFTCFLLVASFRPFCQVSEPASHNLSDQYWKKSADQRTGAWVLLGAGSGAALIGLIISSNNVLGAVFGDDAANDRLNSGGIIMLIGLASIGASIPLFIASGRNRKKAMAIDVSIQRLPLPPLNHFAGKSVPTVTLNISL